MPTNRAGRFTPQPGGYSAFIPNPLPPQPPLRADSKLRELLSLADRAMGRLDGSIQTLPAPDLFVYMYIRKEAVLSSQIEGTQSSLDDLLEAEAKVFNPERPNDTSEVINHLAAIKHSLNRLKDLPISVRLIREAHDILLSGVRGAKKQPGQLRTMQNWIGPKGCTGPGEATFVPPPPAQVPNALADLEQFLHSNNPMEMLLKIGLAHAQFETIHPFLDGNGRIGRLLITLLLCKERVLLKPVLYISHYLKEHHVEYYDRLQAVRDEGDWEGWLKFFLTAVAEVAAEATATARRIVDLRELHRGRIIQTFGRTTANGLNMLEALYSRPIVTVKGIAEVLDVDYSVANPLMKRFCQQGIVHQITGPKRNRRYRYSDYVAIFTER